MSQCTKFLQYMSFNLTYDIKMIFCKKDLPDNFLSIFPNFEHQAKSRRHTALVKKFTVKFYQLWNCRICTNKCAKFCQICAPFAKSVRRLPNANCQWMLFISKAALVCWWKQPLACRKQSSALRLILKHFLYKI